MIVYVETNFIFELAFQQEERSCCIDLLNRAEQKHIELVLPAYSVGEPYEKLIRRRRERKKLSIRLGDELKELGRSASHAEDAERYAELTSWLIDSNEQESQRLNETLNKILSIATIIPTDHHILRTSLEAQRILGLEPQDSIVYASVISFASGQDSPQCFINKNTKDFRDPYVTAEFAKFRCRIIPTFSHGIRLVDAFLRRRQRSSQD